MDFLLRIPKHTTSFRDKTLLKPALHHKPEDADRVTLRSYYKVRLPGCTEMSHNSP
jgi:hypothetical protein